MQRSYKRLLHAVTHIERNSLLFFLPLLGSYPLIANTIDTISCDFSMISLQKEPCLSHKNTAAAEKTLPVSIVLLHKYPAISLAAFESTFSIPDQINYSDLSPTINTLHVFTTKAISLPTTQIQMPLVIHSVIGNATTQEYIPARNLLEIEISSVEPFITPIYRSKISTSFEKMPLTPLDTAIFSPGASIIQPLNLAAPLIPSTQNNLQLSDLVAIAEKSQAPHSAALPTVAPNINISKVTTEAPSDRITLTGIDSTRSTPSSFSIQKQIEDIPCMPASIASTSYSSAEATYELHHLYKNTLTVQSTPPHSKLYATLEIGEDFMPLCTATDTSIIATSSPRERILPTLLATAPIAIDIAITENLSIAPMTTATTAPTIKYIQPFIESLSPANEFTYVAFATPLQLLEESSIQTPSSGYFGFSAPVAVLQPIELQKKSVDQLDVAIAEVAFFPVVREKIYATTPAIDARVHQSLILASEHVILKEIDHTDPFTYSAHSSLLALAAEESSYRSDAEIISVIFGGNYEKTSPLLNSSFAAMRPIVSIDTAPVKTSLTRVPGGDVFLQEDNSAIQLEESKTRRNNTKSRLTGYNLSRIPSCEDLDVLSYNNVMNTSVEVAPRIDQDGYVFKISLDMKEKPALEQPQHYIFILDKADSISASEFEAYLQATMRCLQELSTTDRFSLYVVENTLRPITQPMLTPTVKNFRSVRDLLTAEKKSVFQTNSHELFVSLASFAPPTDPKYHNTIILLSDGKSLASLPEKRKTLAFLEAVKAPEMTLHAATLSGGMGSAMLDFIAVLHHGEFTFANTARSLERKLLKLVKKTASLCATNLQVTPFNEKKTIELYPKTNLLPQLYGSRSFVIYGVSKDLTDFSLLIQGKIGDKYLHAKQQITFTGAKKGTGDIYKEFALHRAYESYDRFIQEGDSFYLIFAQTLLRPYKYLMPFPQNN